MSENLWVKETYENDTEGYVFSESDVYETYTDDMGELYRTMVKEYGRCEGSVYVDTADGPPKRIGWVFLKRMQYENSNETYLRRVWVSLHDAPETRQTTYHYHELMAW